jgi:hypothetical protein
MAEPWEEDYGKEFDYEDQITASDDPFSLNDLIDLESRGRTIDRVYVRCNRLQSCGHQHMATSPSPCRPASSGGCRTCVSDVPKSKS